MAANAGEMVMKYPDCLEVDFVIGQINFLKRSKPGCLQDRLQPPTPNPVAW